jgi:hypothetical protein
MKRVTIHLPDFSSESKSRGDQAYLRLSEQGTSQLDIDGREELRKLERKRSKKRLQQLNEDIELEILEDQVAADKVTTKKEKTEATVAAWALRQTGDKNPKPTKFPKKEEKESEEKSEEDSDVDAALTEELETEENTEESEEPKEGEEQDESSDTDAFEEV